MSHTKIIFRAAAVIGSAILLSGFSGCKNDPDVVDEPAGAVTGTGGVAGFANASGGSGGATGGAGGAVAGMNGGTGGIGSATGGVGGVTAGTGGTTGGMGGATGGMGGMTGGMGGATGGMSGATGGMGGMTGGMGGDDGPPGPCPTGWTCEDTSALGATDKDGVPITGTSCGKGGLVECDDANPAASCPELTKPLCAHVFGVTSCTQLCTQ